MKETQILRDQLVDLLQSRNAHKNFDDIIEGIPAEMYGRIPDGAPYSLWQLLEHIRLTQLDILEFCENPDYVEPVWPEDYWPESEQPPTPEAWAESVANYRSNLRSLIKLVRNTELDLDAQIPHGTGQTFLREFLLVADHTSYHLGQMVVIRRLLGIWPPA